ncbi:MAG: sigma 54-interacting transcriptional regulator [Thermoanaerobacteraceae bacterium]|nr:sigma 54-interacting transcriptional regulator [Thermoanaerobacteraceae bacterium]
MTGMKEEAHPHTLGIVLAGAYSIEKQLALIKSHQLIDTAFDSIDAGMLITDKNLNIIRVNKTALRILSISLDKVINTKVKSIIKNSDAIVEAQLLSKPVYDIECTFEVGGKQVPCNANSVPIVTDTGTDGAVITFREEKYMHNFVNRIVGYRANYVFDNIITNDTGMKRVIESARKASMADCNVLIMGESGTGKELFAQAIHNNSRRSKGPLVAVNCASIPRELVESELFGYERGAFTGANREGHPGKFELADGGTIFLDEIGDLPIEVQPKLLRVLDDRKISRVGGTYDKKLDMRVIAATNKNLMDEVDRKNFRDDLYYRLNVININIPPLREGFGDIKFLAELFI